MKKLIVKLSGLLGLAIFIVPMQVGATADRIVAQYQDGSLWMKEGPVSAQWQPIAGGDPSMSPGNISVSGSRVVFTDLNPVETPVYIKEPNWNSPWTQVYIGNTTAYSYDEKTCQLSNGQYRLLVAYYDGNNDKVIMKNGPYNRSEERRVG